MKSGYGGAGGGATCALQSTIPECDACINGPCYWQCEACVNSQGCIDILQCAQNCSDYSCYAQCEAQFPDGAGPFEEFLGQNGCLAQYCSGPCGG